MGNTLRIFAHPLEYNIPKKSKVAILLGSANHDGEQFEKPTEINFQRENLI